MTVRKTASTKQVIITILAIAFGVLSAGQVAAGDTTYKYDTLGRLIEVVYSDGSKITYTYDAAGNRTQVIKTL